ncbi:uncharacterized protein BO66DRAFT_444327 [Aspergillus aculeatinus CBS 121060]|uniref:Uncharacterized protein n=1 Tax=Aspergillus aculeatinus CBS 121060 TaxID=1448322 RepID=A0ACD1GS21_9EURO|nr:hypothetical protein BO66DRAFT_444327 [Aspergillus aculeatinus CBS 121060]RAH64164.1 hypothetical protein BO66DRAFT_444327 [Aspergillus aculeatinus CBS 121060]
MLLGGRVGDHVVVAVDIMVAGHAADVDGRATAACGMTNLGNLGRGDIGGRDLGRWGVDDLCPVGDAAMGVGKAGVGVRNAAVGVGKAAVGVGGLDAIGKGARDCGDVFTTVSFSVLESMR